MSLLHAVNMNVMINVVQVSNVAHWLIFLVLWLQGVKEYFCVHKLLCVKVKLRLLFILTHAHVLS